MTVLEEGTEDRSFGSDTMKRFSCECGQAVYFENSRCLSCQRELGFLPDRNVMAPLMPGADGVWTAHLPAGDARAYRKCRNYEQQEVCNWMVPVDDRNVYCRSCRLNRVIPNLSIPRNRVLWFRIEQAKRRLIYGILTLGLPLIGREQDPINGLAFEFLEDSQSGVEFSADIGQPNRVMTGHNQGVITINIAEADPIAREEARETLREQYRTLLGHFRHEIGHYYWDRLVRNTGWLDTFRERFGDESADYEQALARYYSQGPPSGWAASFISMYASSHPWEDWGETWSHYLHMAMTLETAYEYGFAIRGKEIGHPHEHLESGDFSSTARIDAFEDMIKNWIQLTEGMNAFNRSMGLPDAYPFALSPPVVKKLRLVHRIICEHVQQCA